MRPVERGDVPVDGAGNPVVFKRYSEARGALISLWGEYCSYCEMELDSSLHVEHVRPKKAKGTNAVDHQLLLAWDNFLLACSNCNSTKGDTPIVLDDYIWPDRDNTFRALIYSEAGVITTAPLPVQQKAQKLLELVGLDKTPLTAEMSDRRWLNRKDAWGKATRARERLAKNDIIELREQIAEHVADKGYWSIWMTVFQDDQDMLNRIIKTMPGTSLPCFNAIGEGIERAGGQC